MLTELLEHEGTWNRVMPGARACVFAREPAEVPLVLPPLHFEALFCRAGSLILTRRDGTRLAAGSREVLLLTDIAGVTAAKMESALSGVLVAVEARAGRESLKTLCGLLGNLSLDTRQVRQWMDRRGGCAVMGRTDWIGAVFDRLEQLPREEWGRYCVLKSVELLYLLCMQETEVLSPQEMDQSRIRTLSEARGYMEEHLEEPLTIEALSRRACLSATAFKEGFRRLYGQPVHIWLRQRRMERAALLLRSTRLTVLAIAQAVGYSSVSQFSAAFRRQYGLTPGQYRKNV